MTDERAKKMDVILECLWSLCRANGLHPSPYVIDLKAEVLLEKLEAIDIEEFERMHEAQLETRELF